MDEKNTRVKKVKKIKRKKRKVMKHKSTGKINYHLLFFVIVLVLFVFAFLKLFLWNKGKDSGYNPDEISTEFEVETMDHIQPMVASRLEGAKQDNVTSILFLGNSPFADKKGEGGLALAIADKMNAVSYDGSFANSFLTTLNKTYQETYKPDGLSLYPIVQAICSGDFSLVERVAKTVGDTEVDTANLLKAIDYSAIDMLVIMYDLSDYIAGRPLYNPNEDTDLATWTGSLTASIRLLEETYPHIRVVFLSPPASGQTIDGFYIDGDKQNMGNGTLVDYVNYANNVALANGISFIDTYYGIIPVDQKEEFLVDEYHLNEKGIQAIADRFHYFFGTEE